jgi:glycine oxidase
MMVQPKAKIMNEQTTANNKQQTENSKPKTVDVLIVGQGLAGSLLARELHAKGVSIAVVDEGAAVTSSKIAAGMFNPINTKRFTVTAHAEKVIGEALEVYKAIESELGVSIVHMQNIYNVFGNVKESNDLSLKSDHPFFQKYTNQHPVAEEHVIQPYGAFEVGLSGWVDVKTMLEAIRNLIATQYHLLEEKLEYHLLTPIESRWQYKDIIADTVVFCEGYKGNQNPFFENLNIIPCKGDVLEFEAPGFNPSRVIKKGIYIVPLGSGKFKAGSLYKWENGNEQIHESDKAELEQKIAELIDVPFTIITQYTAIRPTTKTRESFIKTHPQYSNMHVINGLGTKGVINGVQCVKEWMRTFCPDNYRKNG